MSKRFPGRRLSIVRLALVVAVVVALVVGGVWGFRWWQDNQLAQARAPWYASYVDATATPEYAFETATDEVGRNVVLGFVVAATPDECTPTWGTHYTLEAAQTDLDLDRRIARLRQAGGDVIVSFGGLLNTDLSVACGSVDDLAGQYRAITDRYHLTTIDLDIEGEALTDTAAAERRAEAVAQIQREQIDAGDAPLQVWLTLPVAADGLTADGVAVLQAFVDAGATVAGINAMTMNFGADADDMADLVVPALEGTHRQLMAVYADAGAPVGGQTAWRMVGATPMAGQNDVVTEVFTLDDARKLNAFALEHGIGRVSMWSANRDRPCSAAYVDLTVVSDSCSGFPQGDETFAAILGDGFTGTPDQAATASPPATLRPEDIVDHAATSPYPIWDAEASYPVDTRVVWRRNVYVAMWWTMGTQPDDPSVAILDNPWRLIGPVLQGETPVPTLSLPDDFYPSWVSTEAYSGGDRVMLGGIAYEARWWTQDDNPAAGQLDPGDSPWRVLTQAEISSLLDGE
ncbi:chitinase [Microbacterium sp.]|uniref:chitinase n=1 Tax=Microbacterium sp. TaxID=51671 RepID=UPI003C75000F